MTMNIRRVFRRKAQEQSQRARDSQRTPSVEPSCSRYGDHSCSLETKKRPLESTRKGPLALPTDVRAPLARKSSLKSKASWTEDSCGPIPSGASSSSLEFTVCEHNVEFDKVEIREYAPTLGDQPCAEGPPITISWDCHRRKVVNVDKYERIRRGLRRYGDELKVDADVRRAYLLKNNFTVQEIHDAEAECLKVQQKRISTLRMGNPPSCKR
eukprot:CAMPEP_0194031378 /NCGR_PEP_ID=MMETSP0009_2-20130614/4565_1 /TAXON_ID=210454 /ORGANISM="Grammatophora oceanica, Strain CCMP 410" /LENGTH=211 /DNA_ID=CAMNT_0038671519 /DNA_START=56 /DNA_END=691 /DNA_ORIENTATION=+